MTTDIRRCMIMITKKMQMFVKMLNQHIIMHSVIQFCLTVKTMIIILTRLLVVSILFCKL